MNYPKISNKKCKSCGQDIIMKRKRDEVQEFCGRQCAAHFTLGTQFVKSCKMCGNSFTTIPSHDYDFCSKNCGNQSRRITHIRKCKRCNKEFVLKNIAYEKRGCGEFCSRECATRIYSFDEEYFQLIDTDEKAYWLGMLLSDGNLYKSQMTLKLQKRDKQHLIKFKIALNSQHPIHDVVDFDGHKFSSFFIGSKKLTYQLKKAGMMPRKTFIVEFPHLRKDLNRHFIRGYFDGDGCMYYGKRKHTWSIFSSSPKFINKLFATIKKETKIHFYKTYDNKSIYLNKGNDIIRLETYLYKNATVFLERKKNKFIRAISYINRS